MIMIMIQPIFLLGSFEISFPGRFFGHSQIIFCTALSNIDATRAHEAITEVIAELEPLLNKLKTTLDEATLG